MASLPVIVLALAVGYALYLKFTTAPPRPSADGVAADGSNVSPVMEVEWDSDDPSFVKTVASSRIPVVFRRDLLTHSHPATRWAPLRKWDPYSLWVKSYKEQTMLPNVRVSRGHEPSVEGLRTHAFTLATNRSGPLMHWALDTNAVSYTDAEDMHMHKMLDECCNFRLDRGTRPEECVPDAAASAPRTRHLYFTSYLRNIGSLDATLVGVTEMEENFHVDTQLFAEKVVGFRPEPTQSSLWLGCSGVKAQTHYDKSHNFFLQAVGSKTFTLWSPQFWRDLKIHSAFHPFDRQSQRDWVSERFADGPLSNVNKHSRRIVDAPLQVTLTEGDLLYIPPYWAHAVESDTLAAGVSFLSASEEEMMLAKLKSWADTFAATVVSASAPDAGDDDTEADAFLRSSTIAQNVRRAVRELAARTFVQSPLVSVDSYLGDHYQARFQDQESILQEKAVMSFQRCEDRADAKSTVCTPCEGSTDTPELSTAVAQFVNASAAMLRSAQTLSPVRLGAADLMFIDLVEHIVVTTFGAEHIASFFDKCLRQ